MLRCRERTMMTATAPIPAPGLRFDPFGTRLDRDAALKVLRDAVSGADDGEIFL